MPLYALMLTIPISSRTNENASRSEQWQETFKKGYVHAHNALLCGHITDLREIRRQYWGVLLLIFEWGTTWPFWMPEGVPIDQIPFKDDIGKVVKVSLEDILLYHCLSERLRR